MTQKEIILDYLTNVGELSKGEAFDKLGITKLDTRVSELRAEGVNIKSRNHKIKTRYGKKSHYFTYYIEKEPIRNV